MKVRYSIDSNPIEEANRLKQLLQKSNQLILDFRNEQEKLFLNKVVHCLKRDEPRLGIKFEDNRLVLYSERIVVRFDLANSIRDGEVVVYLSFWQGNKEILDQIVMAVHAFQAEHLLRVKKMVEEGEEFNDIHVSLTDLQQSGTSGIFTFFSSGEQYGLTAEIVQNQHIANFRPGIHYRTHNFITIHDKDLVVEFQINNNIVLH